MSKLLALTALVFFSQLANGQVVCTPIEARAAESQRFLGTWEEVYKSFNKFGHCDRGAISELYSEAVSRLLARRWDTAKELQKIVLTDSNFESFVIRHIDELMLFEYVEAIRLNTQQNCSSELRYLCGMVTNRMNNLNGYVTPCPP